MFLGNAKDGGEALDVPAQAAGRGPVLNIAPEKLNGKVKYMHCFSCLRVFNHVFKYLNQIMIDQFFNVFKTSEKTANMEGS